MSERTIAIVEDDPSLASVLQYNLQQAGYHTLAASDGPEGLELVRRHVPDVVVLDVMIPGMGGLEVCQRIRDDRRIQSVAVIMLTARGSETDQLNGFTAGADDYVTKPFSVRVLLQRIQAVLRRQEPENSASDIVHRRGITVDRLKHRVLVGEQLLDLTPSEFRLIDTLIRQPGRAFARSELIDAALGGDTLVTERTIDVHIRALRKKLGDRADPVETVRGVGYRFQSE